MICAVTVPPLNTTFFLAERPAEGPYDVEEGVELDAAFNLYDGPRGDERAHPTLCRSVSNPKHYKVFKSPREVDPGAFRPTGTNFGGFFSRNTWQRFQEQLPVALADLPIPDGDAPHALAERS
jgi:hypothetical protein